jgi:uncharacterized protein (DUF4415 family)
VCQSGIADAVRGKAGKVFTAEEQGRKLKVTEKAGMALRAKRRARQCLRSTVRVGCLNRARRRGKESAASSACASQPDMKGETMKKAISRPLTARQKTELDVLAAMPDEQINTRALPEVRDWSGACRGVFYRPIKKQLTLRLDADLIDWFKTHTPNGEGYQTRINSALREYVAHREAGRKKEF